MRAVTSRAFRPAALSLMLIGLAACSQYGFPTMSDAVCGVSGHECRLECRVTPMPPTGSDPRAVSYHIGPASCPDRYTDEARDRAEEACRDRGLILASTAPHVADQPPVAPLPAARSATFQCQG